MLLYIAYCIAYCIAYSLNIAGPGPDWLGFGLGGQGSWAGPVWAWLGGPRVLGRTGLVLAWGAKGPGPGRLRFGLGGQGSWAGPTWFKIL